MGLIGNRIDSIYVGKRLVQRIYKGNQRIYSREIPIEKDNENEYFYFRVHDNQRIAQVGFERRTYEYHPNSATSKPAINYSSFKTYVAPTFEYSYDKETWNSYTLGTLLSIGKGQTSDRVYFRGNNTAPWYDEYTQDTTHTTDGTEYTDTHYYRVNTHAIMKNAEIQCNGNLMSLRYKSYSGQLTIPCDYAFTFLFEDCTNMLRHPMLPATTLAIYCYARLFAGCSALSTTPKLPATVMKEGCYATMFYKCAITNPPALPATTLAGGCYGYITYFSPDPYTYTVGLLKGYSNINGNRTEKAYGMFALCNIIISPTLPATALANRCYEGMFCECKQLKTAPTLPATTLASYCYGNCDVLGNPSGGMFQDCTALTTPPALPATTLAEGCYAGMFSGSGITSAPTLSATALKDYCYTGMFYGCKTLTTPPTLPATTMAERCYAGMFADSNITSTPKLPATTLASDCYGGWLKVGMFRNCTKLTKITTLPATALIADCYYTMFLGSNVRISETKTGACTYAYRIPTSGTGSGNSKCLENMFNSYSDDTAFSPSLNTTYYINVPSF